MKRLALFAVALLAVVGMSACKAAGGGSAKADSGTGVVEAGVVEFTFTPLEGTDPEVVYLVGEFNEWIPEDPNMLMEEDDGVYYLEMELDPGTYQYKFHIDGDWVSDAEDYAGHFTPVPGEYVGDGFGGQNAVLEVE